MVPSRFYTTTGIILRRYNSGEGDKILSVLCEHIGKKRFIAKGIRKINSRRSGHTELFSKTAFLVHKGSALDYITGATAVCFYGASFTTLPMVASAYTACETIDRLIMEGQEHDEVYALLDRFFTKLRGTDRATISLVTTEFIDDVLRILGYRRKETKSSSLGGAVASVERIIQRKIKSVHLLSKSGMDLF